jgi:hypothetical protein
MVETKSTMSESIFRKCFATAFFWFQFAIATDDRFLDARFHRAFAEIVLQLQEPTQASIVCAVRRIVGVFAITCLLALAACSLFQPSEAVRSESRRTVYRAAEENPLDVLPETTPSRQKVPGETR